MLSHRILQNEYENLLEKCQRYDKIVQEREYIIAECESNENLLRKEIQKCKAKAHKYKSKLNQIKR